MKSRSRLMRVYAGFAIVLSAVLALGGVAPVAMAALVPLLSNVAAASAGYGPTHSQQYYAVKFATPALQLFEMTAVTAPFVFADGFEYKVTLELRVDEAGEPGTLIRNMGSVTVDQGLTHTFDIGDAPEELESATSYWLVMVGESISAGTPNGGWRLVSAAPTSSQGFAGGERKVFYDGTWHIPSASLTMAFEIQGEHIPPPDTPVTAALANQTPSPTNTATASWIAAFDAPVSGLQLANFELETNGLSGASITSVLPVGGTSPSAYWSVQAATGSGSGDIGISLSSSPPGFAVSGLPLLSEPILIDRDAPTVSVQPAPGQTDPTNSDPVKFDLTFSEPVVGLSTSGVNLVPSIPSGGISFALSGSGSNYLISVTGIDEDLILFVDVSAGAAFDAAGNQNAASNVATVAVDVTPPTPVITGPLGATSDTEVAFEVAMDEVTSELDPADFVVTGGTLTNASAPGQTVTFLVSPTAEGPVTVMVPAGVVHDNAGNLNVEASHTFVFQPKVPEAPEVPKKVGWLPLTGGGRAWQLLPAVTLLMAGGAVLLAPRRRN